MKGKKVKKRWTIQEAIEYAAFYGIQVSRPTLIKWITTYDLGYQLGGKGGKWYVNPTKFQRYIDGGQTKEVPQTTNN